MDEGLNTVSWIASDDITEVGRYFGVHRPEADKHARKLAGSANGRNAGGLQFLVDVVPEVGYGLLLDGRHKGWLLFRLKWLLPAGFD